MDSPRHAGKIALVTGAGSGIGRATAMTLALGGATVIACDMNESALKETMAAASSHAALIEAMEMDVTKQADVDRVVLDVQSRHGGIDVLVNVAGIMDGFLPAHEVDDATWCRVMDVNHHGSLRTARAVLPQMLERGSGVIVNVASEAGLRGGLAGAAYTSSKHAVVGLTKSIAWSYAGKGIRCNAVCPGGVETNISLASRSEFGLERNRLVSSLAIGKAQPAQIAAAIAWLSSSEADQINGAIVPIDGGWSAG
jgi:NAD(P)-dependent dehydrogenase (short-subunit alcohol dehydrogenase family)